MNFSKQICSVIPLFILYTIFILTNFLFCSRIQYKFPPVDVVRIVSESEPNPIFTHIYARGEAELLRNFNDTTIAVIPKLILSSYRLSLELAEGIYFFDNRTMRWPKVQVSTKLESIHGGILFEFSPPDKSSPYKEISTFFRNYISPLYQNTDLEPSEYAFEDLLIFIYLNNLFSIFILLSSGINIGSLVIKNTELTLYLTSRIFLTSSCVAVGLSLSCCILSIIMAAKFPNIFTIFNIIIYMIQTMMYVSLLWFMKKRYNELKTIFEERALIATFEPSPEYAPLTKLESEVSSPKETLDPFVTSQVMVRSSSYSLRISPTSPFESKRWFSEPLKSQDRDIDSFQFN